MGRFSTLATGISGMQAAQAGLYVTGHNMSNVDTRGYSRQQVIQKDVSSVTIGNSAGGVNQVGLGTDVASIRQIRNTFLDMSYRAEAGKYDFYMVKATVGREVETIIGELQSQYSTDSIFKDLWESVNELSIDPASYASRKTFLSTCYTFVNKVNNVSDRMLDYQYNLNEQVKEKTQRVNQLANDIEKYNRLIMESEISGDNANDYRDYRALCLDELSHLIDIDYSEDRLGRVNVMTEGRELVVNGVVNQLGLRYTAPGHSFVEPVFTQSTEILDYDEPFVPLFQFTGPVDAIHNNDSGQLKSILMCRGFYPINYANDPQKPDTDGMSTAEKKLAEFNYKRDLFNQEYCMIPKMQKQFDSVVHAVITMINDAVAPVDTNTNKLSENAPYDLNNSNTGGVEIFVRKHMDRFDEDGTYNKEDPNNKYSLYCAGNIMINPKLLEEGGHNLIALMLPEEGDGGGDGSPSGESDNRTVLTELLEKWSNKSVSINGEELSVDDAYRQFVNNLGTETAEARSCAQEQETLLVQVNNKRQAISAVSLDEELTNMMIYQRSFNAASRVINAVDSMIDKIVNSTGRVGR